MQTLSNLRFSWWVEAKEKRSLVLMTDLFFAGAVRSGGKDYYLHCGPPLLKLFFLILSHFLSFLSFYLIMEIWICML